MCDCLGEGKERSPSVGDVIVLLTGDTCFGMASDRDAGLTIFFFMSYTRLITGFMKAVLVWGQRGGKARGKRS